MRCPGAVCRQACAYPHTVTVTDFACHMQTSDIVRKFYRALEAGELYEDNAWEVSTSLQFPAWPAVLSTGLLEVL